MGTHLRVLSKSYPNEYHQGLDGYKKSLHSCVLDESGLSIVIVHSISIYTDI